MTARSGLYPVTSDGRGAVMFSLRFTTQGTGAPNGLEDPCGMVESVARTTTGTYLVTLARGFPRDASGIFGVYHTMATAYEHGGPVSARPSSPLGASILVSVHDGAGSKADTTGEVIQLLVMAYPGGA